MQLIKRLLIIVILITFFCQIFSSFGFCNENYHRFDTDLFGFKQEIVIAFDTGLDSAKYQPIDLRVDFKNPCWAVDENSHSIRVAYEIAGVLYELESQIYDLKKSDADHVSSCNIVFLIPNVADGREKYYVFYDSSETEKPEYTDRVLTDDSHYFYEPIPGQIIDFDYYEIKQDNEVIYAVIQKGEILGNPVAQNVAKFKLGSKEVQTYNVDQIAGFDIRYGVDATPGYYGTSCADSVEKKILIDGNLMVRFWVKCFSPDKKLLTENIYTYYYSPGDLKKIWVNIHHETYDTIKIEDPCVYDGTLCGIISIRSRSATIEKMNVGEILPEIHIYSENDIVESYEIPTNPSSSSKEIILNVEDDIDLGSKAWIGLYDPADGKLHGIILESNTGFSDDVDGVQVKTWVEQNIKLPGLEADTGNSFLTLNSYEKESGHDTILDRDIVLDYNVEFLNIEKNGLNIIDTEAEIFQKNVKTRPITKDEDHEEQIDEKRYTLTTFVHLAPAVPMGSLLSAALGRNIPYIYAEIYKDNNLKSSGSVSKIPLGAVDFDLEGKKLVEILKSFRGIFDWRDISLYKKIVFPDLEPGRYLVKIYRENPIFAQQHQYIGFSEVEIENSDKTTRVYCSIQGAIEVSLCDQENNFVENANIFLKQNEQIISTSTTNINGSAKIHAPLSKSEPYILEIIYQGFLIEEKEIRLKALNRFKAKTEIFSIKRHDLEINIVDKWDFTPEIELSPRLSSNNMVYPENIAIDKIDKGRYQINNLYPSEYTLRLGYKSYDIEKTISIDADLSLDLVFPAEYKTNIKIMDSYGNILSNTNVILSRNGRDEKQKTNQDGYATLIIPPGQYELKVENKNGAIAKQKIQIYGEKNVDIVTTQDSIVNNFILVLGIILLIFSIIYALWKKKINFCLKLIVISLIIMSIALPWWTVSGEKEGVSTQTNTHLYPSKIVTVTKTPEVIGGDVSQVPAEITMVLNLILIILLVSILLLFIGIYANNRFKKSSKIINLVVIVFILISVLIFIYTISQLTAVSVGSFIGKGILEITIPGISVSKNINCNWGPGIGFYFILISFIILLVNILKSFLKFKKRKTTI